MSKIEVSIIIPCLNEEETIGICVQKCMQVFRTQNLAGEVIVVDNGSADNSKTIAANSGAKVVSQPLKGYGAAYLKGFEVAQGRFLAMGDADDTYDFRDIPVLIKGLREGYDLVIGSRFRGKILKGAMSFSHRYIGNPILTAILNIFFSSRISDAHSGFRAITRDAFNRLNLKTTGMEFASEMIVASLRERLRIKEVPITYYPRKGESKLLPLSDAWRHTRFMLLFSPNWLFIIPGLGLFVLGFLALLFSGWGKLVFLGHRFDIHSMIFFAFFSLLGFQIINLGLFAKTYSFLEGFEKQDALLKKFYKKFNLERGIILGGITFLLGFLGSFYIVIKWIHSGFGPLNEARFCLLGLFLMVVGIQTIFSSFFLSLLGLPKR